MSPSVSMNGYGKLLLEESSLAALSDHMNPAYVIVTANTKMLMPGTSVCMGRGGRT
jgi:hypothetical protein